MLLELSVENLAIVDRLELSFGPGLNVLSGETGAGKSILVDALALMLGGRATSDLVRAGENQGVVSAVIDLGESELARKRFEEKGFELKSPEVLIRRMIGRSGRGRVTIDGQIATVALLAEVTRGLIDICGQHEHVTLVDPETHLDLLDAFGGHGALAKRVEEGFERAAGIDRELKALEKSESEKLRRLDFLQFSLDEIQTIAPEANEMEALSAERTRLAHAQRLAAGALELEGLLYADDGAIAEVLGRVESELLDLARLDPELVPLAKTASSVSAEVSELARQLGRYSRGLSAEPERLGELEERLEVLKRLARKHGGSIPAVLEAAEMMKVELLALSTEEERRQRLSTELDAARVELAKAADALSAARKLSAEALARAVEVELASLSMGATKLSVAFIPLATPGRRGAERAELLIAPNPGEPPRPLSKTASGGELSRLLLSFKRVLSDRDSVATYVFDEVDAGIGGRVAEILGRKLHEVAQGRQVLCITHLPQVAAYSDHHFRVEKQVDAGRTRTVVESLNEKQTTAELARMLGGLDVTEKTEALAREMRARAREIKTEARDPR